MTSIIKNIERAADELKLSFEKNNRVLLHTSGNRKKFFDVFQFNSGEFFICVFSDDYEFALGGGHSITELNDLFCPSHMMGENFYGCIIDICKSLIKRSNLCDLYVQQGNVDGIKNKLEFLSISELISLFNLAAFHGELEICKLIYKKARFMHASHAMVFACQEGKLDTAKWLYSIGGDPHFKDCKCLKHVLYSIKKR